MSYITYKQADSRWGRKNYNGSSSMATAGCGPTSVAMLAYAVDGKTNPWDVAKFMQSHGYAIRNNGTAWAGIPAAMKHFGLENVKNVADMDDVFAFLNKGYCAVFLFRAGSRGGVRWTTAGHYVAVTDYKVKGGKHYLYTRDSGGRNHTGWYAYETAMRGLIPQVWVGKVPASSKKKEPGKPTTLPVLPDRGYFRKGDTGAKAVQDILIYLGFSCGASGADGIYGSITERAVKKFQKNYGLKPDGYWGRYCNEKAKSLLGIAPKKTTPKKTNAEKIVETAKEVAWAYGTKSSKYRYPSGAPVSAYKKALDKAYPDRSHWGTQTRKGASCDVCAGTIIRASGVDKKFPRGLDDDYKYLPKSDRFKKVSVDSKSDLKAGDIIIYRKKSGGGHICIYIGSGRIVEAGYVTKRYPCTMKLAESRLKLSYRKKNYNIFGVYRAK